MKSKARKEKAVSCNSKNNNKDANSTSQSMNKTTNQREDCATNNGNSQDKDKGARESTPKRPPSSSTNGSTTDTSIIVEQPHPHDVLGGRGHGVASHEGNQFFRHICAKYRQIYRKVAKHKKMDICRKVVQEIEDLSPPGRFLEKQDYSAIANATLELPWTIAPRKRILEKISQVLRDRSAAAVLNEQQQLSIPTWKWSYLTASAKNGDESSAGTASTSATTTTSAGGEGDSTLTQVVSPCFDEDDPSMLLLSLYYQRHRQGGETRISTDMIQQQQGSSNETSGGGDPHITDDHSNINSSNSVAGEEANAILTTSELVHQDAHLVTSASGTSPYSTSTEEIDSGQAPKMPEDPSEPNEKQSHLAAQQDDNNDHDNERTNTSLDIYYLCIRYGYI